MPADVPPGFRVYEAVVSRLDAVRPVGSGLTFRCPVPGRHRSGDAHPSCRCWLGARGQLMAKCLGCQAPWGEIVRAVGLPPQEWFPPAQRLGHGYKRAMQPAHAPAKKVAQYAYRDPAGQAYATKSKFSPGFHGRPKDYCWSRPVPPETRELASVPPGAAAVADGADCLRGGYYVATKWADGSWHFRRTENAEDVQALPLPACTPGLYGLERLALHALAVPVFLVEGEKDADVLARLGFLAVSPPNGSSAWSGDYASPLAGRPVIVVPDNDAPGEAHARCAAGSLVWHGVRQLRVLRPGAGGYDVPVGGDLTDWLRSRCDPDREPVEAKRAVLDLVRPLGRYTFDAPGAA